MDRYDIRVLSADDSHNLQQWLDTNGYGFSTQAQPALDYYIGKNWYFSDYQPAWTAAGFTGALTDLTGGKHIDTVTPTPLTSQSCTSTGTVDN